MGVRFKILSWVVAWKLLQFCAFVGVLGGSGFTTNVARLPSFLGSGVVGSKKLVLPVTVLGISTVDPRILGITLCSVG